MDGFSPADQDFQNFENPVRICPPDALIIMEGRNRNRADFAAIGVPALARSSEMSKRYGACDDVRRDQLDRSGAG